LLFADLYNKPEVNGTDTKNIMLALQEANKLKLDEDKKKTNSKEKEKHTRVKQP